MKLNDLLTNLFPDGHQIDVKNSIISGTGMLKDEQIQLLGTTDNTYIGIKEILTLADQFIHLMKTKPGCPILMLVDNNGQRMSLQDELLGLSQYIAHLVSIQDQARRLGHKLISLVYGNSIAGGFIAFGMGGPGRVYAVADAHTSVMNLPAISKVTKLSLDKLEELSKTIPVFAPGCDNFFKMGGLHEIWGKNLSQALQQALDNYDSDDNRSQLGVERGGRLMAHKIINDIVNA